MNAEDRRALAELELCTWLKTHLTATRLGVVARYGKALADHGFEDAGDLERATHQELMAAGFEDADAELVLVLGMDRGGLVRLGRL